jgi:hypothetical protein
MISSFGYCLCFFFSPVIVVKVFFWFPLKFKNTCLFSIVFPLSFVFL